MTFWASNPFYFLLMQFDSTQLVHMQSIIFKYILYVCTKCHVLKVKYFNIQVINYENLNITENTAHNKYALLISHKIDDGFVQWQCLSVYFQKILVKTKKNQCKTQKKPKTHSQTNFFVFSNTSPTQRYYVQDFHQILHLPSRIKCATHHSHCELLAGSSSDYLLFLHLNIHQPGCQIKAQK